LNSQKSQEVYGLTVVGSSIFVGTADSVFRSSNNGGNWTAVNAGLPNTTVMAFAVSGSNIFAGTSGKGIYLSTNNGDGWTAVNTGLPSQTRGNALAVNGTNVFAGTYASGIFLSTDTGSNWVNELTDISVHAFSIDGNHIFAGTDYTGVFVKEIR
jgi:hypothetical protein